MSLEYQPSLTKTVLTVIDTCNGRLSFLLEIGGVLPYMGYISICGPKGYCFSAVLVITRVWILHSSLDMGIFFKKMPLFQFYQKGNQQKPVTNNFLW